VPRPEGKQPTDHVSLGSNDICYREDNFKLFDKPWIAALRFQEPGKGEQLGQGRKAGETTVPDRVPVFFGDDMHKWHSKFEKSINERAQKKKLMMMTHEFNMTTKNSNFHKTMYSLPKRRMSRQSNENFTNIDFECLGNTNNVIKPS
jgi:hypothetical protein